jgi:ABC-type uncharacterized transport system substrate-binding protein
LSYGPNQAAINQVIAQDVDKLLKGTPIASLPIQQASRFELVVNQRTARAVGVAFTPLFLAQADEVLE